MDFVKLMQAQLDAMKALFEAASAEDRDLTEDEQKRYDAAEAEFNRLKAAKEKADRLAAMQADIPQPELEPAHEPAANSAARVQKVNAGDDQAAKKPYDTLGDMLQDVARNKNGSREAKERLMKASLNTETGADGGFLVPEDFIGGMLEAADSQSQLFSRSNQLTIRGNTANIPAVDETSCQHPCRG
jgi:HK97 family phage major capsid protein